MKRQDKERAAKEREVKYYRGVILQSVAGYVKCREYGCRDPFWPDGCNMNLEVNHIVHAKKELLRLCDDLGQAFPGEYYIATPPEVSEKYMAVLKKGATAAKDPVQRDRLKRIRQTEWGLVGECPDYDPYELSLV